MGIPQIHYAIRGIVDGARAFHLILGIKRGAMIIHVDIIGKTSEIASNSIAIGARLGIATGVGKYRV